MTSRNPLLPSGPFMIEPVTDPDDGSEYSILDRYDHQVAVTYGADGVPGSAKAMAELFLKALEQQS